LVISVIALLLFVSLSALPNTVYGAYTPTLSSYEQTETTITLTWTKSTDILFSSYTVTYSTSVNGYYTPIATITDKSQTSYAVTGLSPLTPYYFIVKDTANDVITSSTSSSNTYEADTRANPTISVDSSTPTTISLSWHTYNVYPYSTLVPFYGIVVQMRANGQFSTIYTTRDVTQTTYTVTGLSPASNYQFQIYDQVGDSGQYTAYSNTITGTTTQSPPTPTQDSSSPSSVPTTTSNTHTNPIDPGIPMIYVIIIIVVVIAVMSAVAILALKRKPSPPKPNI